MTQYRINNSVNIAEFGGFFTATPTPILRFINRDERKILQQQWRLDHSKNGTSFEWKDVPLEEVNE